MEEHLPEARRTRIGIATSTALIITGVMLGAFQWVEGLQLYLVLITTVLCVLGMALVLLHAARRIQTDTESSVLHFLQSPGYWGVCIIMAAVTTFGIVSLLFSQPAVVHARAETVPLRVVEFPALKVQGVVLNGTRSSAIINSRTVHLGEKVEGAQLVEIFENGVAAELEGIRKIFLRDTIRSQSSIHTNATSPNRLFQADATHDIEPLSNRDRVER